MVRKSRKTCPTNRGLRLKLQEQHNEWLQSRKTCPTNRGLRLSSGSHLNSFYCRKTCPTNRGLRLNEVAPLMAEVKSEDLPH